MSDERSEGLMVHYGKRAAAEAGAGRARNAERLAAVAMHHYKAYRGRYIKLWHLRNSKYRSGAELKCFCPIGIPIGSTIL